VVITTVETSNPVQAGRRRILAAWCTATCVAPVATHRTTGTAANHSGFFIEQVGDTAAQCKRLVDVPVSGQVEDVVAVGLDFGRGRVAQNDAGTTSRNIGIVFDNCLLACVARIIYTRQVTPAQTD